MTVQVSVRDGSSNNRLQMELESETTIDEVIEATADHWKKPRGAYVLKWGNALLRGDMRVDEVGVGPEDFLELIPDPESG